MKTACLLLLMTLLQSTSFKEKQLQHNRVKAAFQEKEETVKKYFTKATIDPGNYQLFLRAFKKEGVLEVWGKEKTKTSYSLLTAYDFCTLSGTLGPKRKEGDLQVPEGIYHIAHFNPVSNFHLSLGLNYPNASDQILSNKEKPGGDIYIHGNCVSIGCIPITDEKIKELYIMSVEAKNQGQEKIPVHIFPARLTTQGMKALQQDYSGNNNLLSFWENLKRIYEAFETDKQLKSVKVNSKGRYYF